jgi:hypothetical protein
MVFPLYVTFFPPNQAYAVFGVFLLLTFWLYLLGFIIVLGAELNAFLKQPARAVALSEATAAALHGQIESQTPQLVASGPSAGASLAGRLLGFVGLLVAVLLLRGRTAKPTDDHASA